MSDPRPAAVSAPAGEATCANCGHPPHGGDGCAECAKDFTEWTGCVDYEPRSPAPASGAPDEEDRLSAIRNGLLNLALEVGGIAAMEKPFRDLSFLLAKYDALRTRLAASERAGEALREESSAWADYAAHLEICRTCSETSWRDCYEGEQLRAAVIPPTAPSVGTKEPEYVDGVELLRRIRHEPLLRAAYNLGRQRTNSTPPSPEGRANG